MANMSSPPKNDFVVLPEDMYEVLVADVTEIPNTFYDPTKDSSNKSTQLDWKLVVRDGEVGAGTTLKAFSSASLSRDSRSKVTAWVKLIDQKFDIEVGYPSFEAFRSAMIGKGARALVKNKPVEKDGETKIYNKVDGLLATKLPPIDTSAIDALMESIGATVAPL